MTRKPTKRTVPLSTAEVLTPGEVAAIFRVDTKTVARWARMGRLSSIRTPGGHRRFRKTEVKEFFDSGAGAWTTG